MTMRQSGVLFFLVGASLLAVGCCESLPALLNRQDLPASDPVHAAGGHGSDHGDKFGGGHGGQRGDHGGAVGGQGGEFGDDEAESISLLDPVDGGSGADNDDEDGGSDGFWDWFSKRSSSSGDGPMD